MKDGSCYKSWVLYRRLIRQYTPFNEPEASNARICNTHTPPYPTHPLHNTYKHSTAALMLGTVVFSSKIEAGWEGIGMYVK
jgi:hypothetical protein